MHHPWVMPPRLLFAALNWAVKPDEIRNGSCGFITNENGPRATVIFMTKM